MWQWFCFLSVYFVLIALLDCLTDDACYYEDYEDYVAKGGSSNFYEVDVDDL